MLLIRYEAARAALDAAVMFDEVTAIIDAAERAAVYAKQANDNDLIEKATEIRVRAQRKAGEMLTKAAEQGMRATAGTNQHRSSQPSTTSPTLSEIGLTRDQSSRYQQLAAMSDENFETAVATAKATAGEVSTAFMLREARTVRRPRNDRVNEMRELVAKGHSPEQIAQIQGLGVERVRELLRDADIKVPMQKRGRAIDSTKIVRESVAALSGIAQGLALVGDVDIDPDEARDLLTELRGAMKALRNLDSTLKGLTDGK